MAQKILFDTELTDLRTSDVEGLGVLRYDELGNVYKWVKNTGSTALTAAGSCLVRLGSTAVKAVGTRVISPDGAGASTGIVSHPGGVPVTGIAASGAATGDHGWVLVEGIKKLSVYQGVTALAAGQIVLATSVGGWDKPATWTAGQSPACRYVKIAEAVATTGAATAASAICYVRCLG